MKKQFTILAMVLFVTVNGFSLDIDNDPGIRESLESSNSVLLEAIPSLSGHVTSIFGVTTGNGTYSNPMHVGTKLGVDYKTILTFDTSSIPDNAQINYCLLLIGVEIDNFPGDYFYYIFQNLAIDFSGIGGFGGTYTLSGADYYFPGIVSFQTVIGNAAIGGLMLNLDINQNLRDLTPYINKQGMTQIRLRFFQNPGLYQADLFAMDYPDLDKITLYIAWE